jgi:hypothetical protein
MFKEYTITENGSSKGNIISQPFKIMVHAMNYSSNENEAAGKLTLGICTLNSIDFTCENDDIKNVETFALPGMGSSKTADLANSIEVLLEEKYPGNWS